MDTIIEFLKTDTFLIILSIINIILLLTVIINFFRITKMNKKYKKFIKKLGNGNNIEEDLQRYMQRIEKVEKENKQIKQHCKNIDDEIYRCIQKVGIVRYSAFKDTGSDLSFALALLNEENSGVVLNGIYSREMSNIYAKPVSKGKSQYTLSKEEEAAIYNAIDNEVNLSSINVNN